MDIANHICKKLNEAIEIDRESILSLLNVSVSCRQQFHEKSYAVTRVLHSQLGGGEYAVSCLGFINGLVEDGFAVAFVDGKFAVCVRDSDPNRPERV